MRRHHYAYFRNSYLVAPNTSEGFKEILRRTEAFLHTGAGAE
jgi:hypothetical protein